MGGRSGGGARGGGMRAQQKALKAQFAAMSAGDRYNATQKISNTLFLDSMAPKGNITRKDRLETFLTSLQKKGGFSGDVAGSVLKSMNYYNGGMISNMSQKQAWVLAKGAVEHGIKY